MSTTVFSIGHSNHSLKYFIELLKQHEITALADVRSKPYSRINPQFNKDELRQALRQNDIAYVFLGEELGGRSDNSLCCDHGKVLYDKVAETTLFQRGLERVIQGAKDFRITLMCSEKEPLECHRTILVARHLYERGLEIKHIHSDGSLETHEALMKRLLSLLGLEERDMFLSKNEVWKNAYYLQGLEISYEVDSSKIPVKSIAGGGKA